MSDQNTVVVITTDGCDHIFGPFTKEEAGEFQSAFVTQWKTFNERHQRFLPSITTMQLSRPDGTRAANSLQLPIPSY
jgi:hypothetical protein